MPARAGGSNKYESTMTKVMLVVFESEQRSFPFSSMNTIDWDLSVHLRMLIPWLYLRFIHLVFMRMVMFCKLAMYKVVDNC